MVSHCSLSDNKFPQGSRTFLSILVDLNNVVSASILISNFSCFFFKSFYPVGSRWGCRIPELLFCRGVRHPFNECPRYDTKQSDGDVPVMLELWGMWNIPLLPLLSGPLWLGIVAIGSNRTKLCTYAKLNSLKWNCFDI